MAGTRSSDISDLIVAGIDVIFNRALANETRMYYPEICMEKPNEKETGIYETLGALGPAYEKPEGDEFEYAGFDDGYQTEITVATYGNAVAASFERLTNDLYSVANRAFGAPLVRTLVINRERKVADQYNDGFATTGTDGVYIFSATHPLVNNTELYNDNLASGALTVDNLKNALAKFNFIYDQSGEYFDTSATHLLIHPNKLFHVRELLESQLLAFELSNTKNSLMEVPLKVVANRYLDYTAGSTLADAVSPWFLLDKTLEAGVVMQRQTAPKIDLFWHHESLEYRGQAYERLGFGTIAHGYGMVGSPGS